MMKHYRRRGDAAASRRQPDEFQPLVAEPKVRVRFIGSADELGTPDLMIVPGTKSTLADLSRLRERGLDDAIRARHATGTLVFASARVADAGRAHRRRTCGSRRRRAGLGLLPVVTISRTTKSRAAPRASRAGAIGEIALTPTRSIWAGRTRSQTRIRPAAVRGWKATARERKASGGRFVIGTYMHGLLENPQPCAQFSRDSPKGNVFRIAVVTTVDAELDRLASTVRAHVDLEAITT